MDKYKFRVTLDVEVEAFDAEDAFDKLQDAIGAGDDLGVNVTDCDYKPKRK